MPREGNSPFSVAEDMGSFESPATASVESIEGLQELLFKQMELLQQASNLNKALAAKAFAQQTARTMDDTDILRQRSFSEPPHALTPAEVLRQPLLQAQEREKPKPPRRHKETNKMRSTLHEETEIRARLREVISCVEDEDNVLRTEGLCQAVTRDMSFQIITLTVILLNVVWIWVDTDYNKAETLSDAEPVFQIVNNLFCTFFVFEIVVRLWAHKRLSLALARPVFLFDLFLCFTMVWETWLQVLIVRIFGSKETQFDGVNSLRVLRIFRVTRITRIARMARLVRLLPELMVLVRGMTAGMRSVAAILLLLFIIVYVFGITFTQLGCFDYVPHAMQFLLSQVLCGFDSSFLEEMLHRGFVFYSLWVVYMLMASFTLMNMLIGILCQVVGDERDESKEDIVLKDLEREVDHLAGALGMGDYFGTHELELLRRHPSHFRGLIDLGVDFVAFLNIMNLFVNESSDGDLTLEELKHLISHCRGSKQVTLKDLVDQRKFFSMEIDRINSRLDRLVDRVCPEFAIS